MDTLPAPIPLKPEHPPDQASVPTFRPLTPDERQRQARRSVAMAEAARAMIAERQARQLWPERAPHTADSDPSLPIRTPLAEPEPWVEPVDAGALITNIANLIDRHLYLPEHGATLLALWALHAWAPAAGTLSPRIALTSAEAQSGKSTALRLLGALTPRPLLAMHARAMPLIRTIDILKPTLFFDDAERWLWPNRVLRSVLAAGAAPEAKFLRESKGPFELPALSCFAACAFTVTGRVPADIARRTITLTLCPAIGQEQRPQFRSDDSEAAQLTAQAVRWSRDNAATLRTAQPEAAHLPRAQRDLWRPLLAIADAAGGTWPERANAAALAFARRAETRSLGVELLDDIRTAFGHDFDRLATVELIKMLTANLERPWQRMTYGRALSPRDLAQMLAPFGIRPRFMRFADGTSRGYLAKDFADAFARYLEPRVYTPYEDM